MFKKIFLIAIASYTFLLIPSAFAAFDQPNTTHIDISDIVVRQSVTIPYTLYRTNKDDVISPSFASPLPVLPPNATLTLDNSGGASNCMVRSGVDGKQSCTLKLIYKNPNGSIGTDPKVDFVLAANQFIRLPGAGSMSFTVTFSPGFASPITTSPPGVIATPGQKDVELTYHLTRLVKTATISSTFVSTPTLPTGAALKIQPAPKSTCLAESTTDPFPPTGQDCTLVVAYTNAHALTDPIPTQPDTGNFVLSVAGTTPTVSLPTTGAFSLSVAIVPPSGFEEPSEDAKQGTGIALPQATANINYTLKRLDKNAFITDFFSTHLPNQGTLTIGKDDPNSTCSRASTNPSFPPTGEDCTLVVAYTNIHTLPVVDPDTGTFVLRVNVTGNTPGISLPASATSTPFSFTVANQNPPASFEAITLTQTASAYPKQAASLKYTLKRLIQTATISPTVNSVSNPNGGTFTIDQTDAKNTCLKAAPTPFTPNDPCDVFVIYTNTHESVLNPTPDTGTFRFIATSATGAIPTYVPAAPNTLGFTVTILPPPAFTINAVTSFALKTRTDNTAKNQGPISGGTGIEITGSGFNTLPKDPNDPTKINAKIKFLYTNAGTTTSEAATNVNIENDNLITANTPKSPIPGPAGTPNLGSGTVAIQITDATDKPFEPATANAYVYRNPSCTVQTNGDPSECVAQLQPCITVPQGKQDPHNDRYIKVTAEKPADNQCVDSIPKFDMIVIQANKFGNFCAIPATGAPSYNFVADRESPNCRRTAGQATPVEQQARLNIVYQQVKATPTVPRDTILISLATSNSAFLMLTPPPLRDTSGYCITNQKFDPLSKLPTDCKDPNLLSPPVNGGTPNTFWALFNFKNNDQVTVLNTKNTVL